MQYVAIWDSILDSPKLMKLPPEVFRFWTLSLVCAQRWDYVDGGLPDVERLTHWLRMPEDDVRRLLSDLLSFGLLDPDGDGWKIHDWNDWRNVKDPGAAKRMRKMREAKRNALRPCYGPVTDPLRDGYGPVTTNPNPNPNPNPSRGSACETLSDAKLGGEATPIEPFQSPPPPPGEPLDPKKQALVDLAARRWGASCGDSVVLELLHEFPAAWVRSACDKAWDQHGAKLRPAYLRGILRGFQRDGGPPASAQARAPAAPAAPLKYTVCHDPDDLIPPALRGKKHA